MKHKQELMILQGLPASGKSTYAKALVDGNYHWKRVNKDSLRDMVDGGAHSKEREKLILAAQLKLVDLYLANGYSVVVDNTNLHQPHVVELQILAAQYGAEVIIDDTFLAVPLDELLERDKNRANSVGPRVIRDFARRYRIPPYTPKEVYYRPDLPQAIICDIDGTIANIGFRDPYDASKCAPDKVNPVVEDILNRYRNTAHILFVSGRSEDYRTQTHSWLWDRGLVDDRTRLFMRPSGDSRKDNVVKLELFNTYIRDTWNVLFVLDDRTQVVRMWRRDLGLTCLQVDDGDF